MMRESPPITMTVRLDSFFRACPATSSIRHTVTLWMVKGRDSSEASAAAMVWYPRARTSITAISRRVMGVSGEKVPPASTTPLAAAVLMALRAQLPSISVKASAPPASLQRNIRTSTVTNSARVMDRPTPKVPSPMPPIRPYSPAARMASRAQPEAGRSE